MMNSADYLQSHLKSQVNFFFKFKLVVREIDGGKEILHGNFSTNLCNNKAGGC